MRSYILRRLLLGVLVVWGVYTLTFFAVNLAPGDPFANLENPKMQKEDIEQLRRKWGYDRPVLERYVLQLRKMFWAERDVLARESRGLRFEVFAAGGRNVLRAVVQSPPDRVRLEPTELSALGGAAPVELERAGTGWTSAAIRPGTYLFGERKLTVRDDRSAAPFFSLGLRLEVADGRVSARPALPDPPAVVVLSNERREIALPRGEDGHYGPAALAAARYRHEGNDILIPEDLLEPGGLTFDLGQSVMQKERVTEYLAPKLVNTLLLAGAALLVDFIIGIFIGVISAVRPNSKLDHGLTIGSLFIYSMPGFWLALMLVLLFSVKLGWLPATGMHDAGEGGFWDLIEHMILPVFVLGIAAAASTARYQRSALIEVMSQDYIRTARAKGLDERTVIWHHAMRNSLLPVITLIGLSLPFLVSGAVITEKIFSWPGMGTALLTAISGRDVFVLTGITLISTTMVVVGNLVADILYAFADPRVRLR